MFKTLVTALCGLLLLSSAAFAQGVTTAAMNGVVSDNVGQPLFGANVMAVHVPSGTRFGVTTRPDGRYNLQNLRVGGPYTVTVSMVGYQPEKVEGITFQLSQNLKLDFTLTEEAVQIGEVKVVGERSAIMSASRTGAATNVLSNEIEVFPTIARSFQEFAKFTPQVVAAGGGSSVAGRNSRLNNIQIDGSVYNDLFGLGTAGTPGASAGSNPISLDALQEFQVVIAPFDVRQSGFTGGGINAITRSGANRYTGSVYGFYRNQGFMGKSPDTLKQKYANFTEYQTGLRIGGPIMQNKLFFFANAELTKRQQPLDNVALKSLGGAIADTTVDRIASTLQSKYVYDPTGYGTFTLERPSTKIFARLDWNISEQHRLTLRNNFVDASDDNMPRNKTLLQFNDYNYKFKSQTNSTVLQLSSTFQNTLSNELIVGYTRMREKRETPGAPFPSMAITVGTGLTVKTGTEQYSGANQLDQDVIEITDNLTYFMGNHVLTVGTHNEIFGFRNLYIRDFYGNYEFASLADFVAGKPSRYTYSYSNTSDPKQAAKWSAIQYGIYAQDEWTVLPSLRITAGIRVDDPTFPDKPADNPKFDSTFASMGLKTSEVPSGNLLFSPRLGFNWDASGDRTTELRGGAGLFTGRVPYVWVSNQYSNTGIEFSRVDKRSPTFLFVADPYGQPRPPAAGLSPVATTEVDIANPNFKMPQLLRADLAVDHQLPFSIVGTLEGIYSKTVNDVYYQDINLGAQVGTFADGRPKYGTQTAGSKYATPGQVNPLFTNVPYMTNTSKGYTWSITAQLQRQMTQGLFGTLAYTYSQAKDQNSVVSSQALSQWRYNPTPGDPNNVPLTTSNFDMPHRVLAAVSYKFDYLAALLGAENSGLSTTISVFYNGQSGQPFSYTYDGDVNADGQTGNDLIYVPAFKTDINLGTYNKTTKKFDQAPQSMYDQLDAYIMRDDYLKSHRSEIMERNAARTPWFNEIDMRIAQDFKYLGHDVQITLDVLNVLNIINSDWGWYKYVPYQNNALLSFQGVESNGRPWFTFRDKKDPYTTDPLTSRWTMQLGLRYSF